MLLGCWRPLLSGSVENFDRAVGWSTIFAFVLAATGAAFGMLGRSRTVRNASPTLPDEQARRLAEIIRIADTRSLRRLVGGDDPAHVRFSADRTSGDAAPEDGVVARLRELLRFGDAAGRELGDLTAIAQYFRSLPLPRMVDLRAARCRDGRVAYRLRCPVAA